MSSEPVSILFAIPNFITAGSGRAMLNIIERLDRERFAPAVCVARKGGDLDKAVDQMGIPFIEAPFTVPSKPYISLLSRARMVAHVFRPYEFALWHSFHYADDYTEAIIARLAGARAWMYTKKNMSWGGRAWKLRSLLATRVATQNNDMLRDFFPKFPYKDKTRLIQRGVDTKVFKPGVAKRLALRQKLDIPTDAVVVSVVAHLLPVKGHPTLLRALAHAREAHLLLAGKSLDVEYVDHLQCLCKDLDISGRVHFLGGVEDVPALLAETDIFVLPTWARWRMEGCPVALLEAMACGVACIATDIPGSRDLIEHEVSGLLVPPEDFDAMTKAVRMLSENQDFRQRLGSSARKRVVQNFTIEREVADHEEMYAELLG